MSFLVSTGVIDLAHCENITFCQLKNYSLISQDLDEEEFGLDEIHEAIFSFLTSKSELLFQVDFVRMRYCIDDIWWSPQEKWVTGPMDQHSLARRILRAQDKSIPLISPRLDLWRSTSRYLTDKLRDTLFESTQPLENF